MSYNSGQASITGDTYKTGINSLNIVVGAKGLVVYLKIFIILSKRGKNIKYM